MATVAAGGSSFSLIKPSPASIAVENNSAMPYLASTA
jgi:hypothetical protein